MIPVSNRRRSISATNSSSGTGRFDIVDAIIANRLFPNSSIKIGPIYVAVKDKQSPCLIQHFRRSARSELAHAICDNVLDGDDSGYTVFAKIDKFYAVSVGQTS